MGYVDNIVDNLYKKFLLRDIFGRIAPGLIVLFIGIHYYYRTTPGMKAAYIEFLGGLSGWLWLSMIIISWIFGIALHSIGEFIGIIRNHPPDRDFKRWLNDYFVTFLGNASAYEKEAVERIEVVKESAGIGSISILVLLIYSILILINDINILSIEIFMILLLLIIFASLVLFHRFHVKLQGELVDVFNNAREK